MSKKKYTIAMLEKTRICSTNWHHGAIDATYWQYHHTIVSSVRVRSSVALVTMMGKEYVRHAKKRGSIIIHLRRSVNLMHLQKKFLKQLSSNVYSSAIQSWS